jgi:copper chaperone NosL
MTVFQINEPGKGTDMKSNQIKTSTRMILFACGLALIAVLIAPMWRIELAAPQYPEGLIMLIYANKLGGNVDIINGLNHYIGMKTLHTEDFIEFTVLPGIIIFFIIAFILTAFAGRRKWLNVLFILFVCFGVIAMVDFWRWEYNYGHNLNPEAAIIVPGMAYQPPLIGFKQLLNFGAYSIPDVGGWIFVSAGAVLLLLVIYEWKLFRKNKRSLSAVKTAVTLGFLFTLNSCTPGPEALVLGTDHCYFCKMTISDNRFGGELLTKKGKLYKFDDEHCLFSFINSKEVDRKEIAEVYFMDFAGGHHLIKSGDAFLLQSDSFRGPMNGNTAAFSNEDSMKKFEQLYHGQILSWKLPNP